MPDFTPDEVIAPRDDEFPHDTQSFIRSMMTCAYSEGTVLRYHDFRLYSRCNDDTGTTIFDVYTTDGQLIETLNLNAFRTGTAVEQLLDKIVAYDPDDHEEWVSRR